MPPVAAAYVRDAYILLHLTSSAHHPQQREMITCETHLADDGDDAAGRGALAEFKPRPRWSEDDAAGYDVADKGEAMNLGFRVGGGADGELRV
jgi:hypothetical protein